jgi:glucosylglycerate synthase
MDREQLLRSMTPLYLGWVAGFVNEAAPLSAAETEVRVERLCEAFEAEKPYLISRWRWPDRFSP